MKQGDAVIHKKTNARGIILMCSELKPGVIVDYSDKTGVMCRWSNKKDLDTLVFLK